MKTTTWTGVVLCTLLTSFLSGCKKDRMEVRYFNCTINGEKFESPYSNSLFSRNTDPQVELQETGDSVQVTFLSECNSVDKASRSPNYVFMWKLQVPRPLTTGVRYEVSTRQDIDMDRRTKQPFCELYFWESVKEENPDPSFTIYYMEDRRFSGTGFVEFSRIDLDKNQFDGRVEFDFLPNIDNPDSTRRLSLNGEWKILGEEFERGEW